jgi:hypothetical protein
MPKTSGSWIEERLFVLRTIEDLKAEVRRISENTATERVALLEKGARDIHAAHEKIRALEAASTHLRIKNWFMAAVLSGIGALCFELVKAVVEGLLRK